MTWQIGNLWTSHFSCFTFDFFFFTFSVVTSVRVLPAPKTAPSHPMPPVSTGYYMSVIIFIMAGFAGVAFFTIILLMCLKRRKRWKRQKRCVNISKFMRMVQLQWREIMKIAMCLEQSANYKKNLTIFCIVFSKKLYSVFNFYDIYLKNCPNRGKTCIDIKVKITTTNATEHYRKSL